MTYNVFSGRLNPTLSINPTSQGTNRMSCTPCLKKRPTFGCYNFDTRERILTVFGTDVTDKVSNQKTLYYATSNNLCFCTTW